MNVELHKTIVVRDSNGVNHELSPGLYEIQGSLRDGQNTVTFFISDKSYFIYQSQYESGIKDGTITERVSDKIPSGDLSPG